MRILSRIKRAVPVLGGNFTSHTYMHGENGWIDAHFLGTKPPIFYSLALQTTIYEYKELVRSRAWDLSYDLAPERELPLFDGAVVDADRKLTHQPAFAGVTGPRPAKLRLAPAPHVLRPMASSWVPTPTAMHLRCINHGYLRAWSGAIKAIISSIAHEMQGTGGDF